LLVCPAFPLTNPEPLTALLNAQRQHPPLAAQCGSTSEKLVLRPPNPIERVINNILGMYGDMQGIIGASLLQIKSLERMTLITEGKSGSDEDKEDIPF